MPSAGSATPDRSRVADRGLKTQRKIASFGRSYHIASANLDRVARVFFIARQHNDDPRVLEHTSGVQGLQVTRQIVDGVCRDFDLAPLVTGASAPPLETPAAPPNVTAFFRPSIEETVSRPADVPRWNLWRRLPGRGRA